MARASLHVNQAAVEQLARRPDVKRAVSAAAAKIADAVNAQHIQVNDNNVSGQDNLVDIPVVTHELDQDPGTNVILAHPAGVAVQAKYGALTKAASAAGHQVHPL